MGDLSVPGSPLTVRRAMSAQAAQPHPHEAQDRELSLRQRATPGSEGKSDPVASGEPPFGSRLLPTAAAFQGLLSSRGEQPSGAISTGRVRAWLPWLERESTSCECINGDQIRTVSDLNID